MLLSCNKIKSPLKVNNMSNNRKATAGRIITQTPIFEERITAFGLVMQRTNRFVEHRTYSVPNFSRLMTPQEKDLRKRIKKLKGDKTKAFELSQLRLELHKMLYN